MCVLVLSASIAFIVICYLQTFFNSARFFLHILEWSARYRKWVWYWSLFKTYLREWRSLVWSDPSFSNSYLARPSISWLYLAVFSLPKEVSRDRAHCSFSSIGKPFYSNQLEIFLLLTNCLSSLLTKPCKFRVSTFIYIFSISICLSL